jgi:hypothetical protein
MKLPTYEEAYARFDTPDETSLDRLIVLFEPFGLNFRELLQKVLLGKSLPEPKEPVSGCLGVNGVSDPELRGTPCPLTSPAQTT